MKALLFICMIIFSPFVTAHDTPASPSPVGTVVKGEVLEVKDVESYTYLHLKTKDGETWAAVNKASVRKGAEVTLENVMVMNNFKSTSLNRTFPTLLFGTLSGPGENADMGKGHPEFAKMAEGPDIHIPKARGKNAHTIAEIIMHRSAFVDKPVVLRAKVVKYNPAIMGKNWVHLRDGSGSASANTNEILVTTTNETKVGDVVTVEGTVRVNKDFGAGYSYKVLIEEATLR
ncbi:MAG: nucleotide-binding protein [Thiobacillaceae bacterium]